MPEVERLPDPLHMLWVTGRPSSTDPDLPSATAGLGHAPTLAGVGVDTCLQVSGEPLAPDGSQSVVHAGAFRRRVFESSPSSEGDVGLRGPYLLSVQLFVPDLEQQEDCRRWLDEEHSGRQLAVPGTWWYAGYESQDGDFNFLNLWGLESPDVIETPEWVEARETPWRDRLLERGIVHTERLLFQW
jgi:hypothetical protein